MTAEAKRFTTVSIASVEWAHHVALAIERQIRRTNDPNEQTRLRNLRDWHYASLTDQQISRGDTT